MEKIETSTALKKAIQELEYQQSHEWDLLKAKILNTYELLKPVNLMKGAFHDLVTSPGVKRNLINGAVGITAGLIAKNAGLSRGPHPLVELVGTIIKVVQNRRAAKKVKAELMSNGAHAVAQ